MAKVNNKRSIRMKQVPMISEQGLSIYRWILLSALAVVLFYPPFLRGLYFETEQLPAEIYVFVVFCVFWIYKVVKRDKRFLVTPIDYASFSFVIVYFLSIFVAVGMRQAIGEWLKYCMYFAIFFMISELANTYRERVFILWVIIASALGVSVIGIDGAAGANIASALNNCFKFMGAENDIIFGTFVGNRINSTLQYPNALASYLMAVYFVTLGIMTSSSKIWTRLISGAASYILIITFMLTMSRGAYLFLPVAAALFVIFLPKESRVRGVIYAIPSVVALVITIVPLLGYMTNTEGNGVSIWKYIFIGVVIAAVLSLVASFVTAWFEKLSWKLYGVLGAIIIVAGVVGTITAVSTKVPLEMSHKEAQADSEISVRRSLSLKPEKEYKLVFEVEARNASNKPNAYSIRIASRNFAGTIEGKDIPIDSFEGNSSNGVEKKEIKFTVPADSRTVSFTFINNYQGTGAVFHNAKVLPVNHSDTESKLTLKYKYIPESLYSRFDEAKETKSGIERTIFYRDGMEIIKDHWLLGAGGGSWPILYFSYQSYLYWTTQAHNYIVQIGVECGILGLLILIAMFVAIGLVLITGINRRSDTDKGDAVLQTALFTAIVAMFMHSAIDFDLSLSAVFLVLWEFVALFNSIVKNQEVEKEENKYSGRPESFWSKLDVQNKLKKLNMHPVIGIIAILIIIVFPISFLSAVNSSKKSSSALRENNVAAALKYTKQAAQTDNFMPNYKIDYANLVLKKGQNSITQKDLLDANKYAKQVENAARHNVDIATRLGAYYLATGVIDKGLGYIEKAAELRPFRPEEWQQKADASMQVAFHYLQKDDKKNADIYFDKVLGIASEVKEVNKRNMIPFVLNPVTQELLERVQFIKDNENAQEEVDLSKLVFYSLNDMDVDSNGVPDQWSVNIHGEVKLGSSGKTMIAESVAGKTGFIQSRPLSLQSGKNYRIEVELANGQWIDSIPFAISGISEQNDGLKLTGGVYAADVSTPAQFKLDKNVLMLGVNGKYEIKSVRVMER